MLGIVMGISLRCMLITILNKIAMFAVSMIFVLLLVSVGTI